ncbi:MAG: DNA replication/repair protein RecF [Alphaproteobacteria bacterium]|nr:MAG: DNA replication/repair protein RecF [Alphaproteobacteria bacterium]
MSELAIERMRLSHFRSYRHLSLDVPEGPVAIFGLNGAGKTNILEAVSLLSPGRGLRRAAPADLPRQPEAIGWKIAASVRTPTGRHEVETEARGGASRSVRIDEKPAPQVALGRVLRMLWLTPAMDRIWIEGAEGRRRFLDRMALSFRPEHADAAIAYEKAMRERNRLLREGIRDEAWFDALEARMAEAGAALSQGRRAAIERLNAEQAGPDGAFPAAELGLSGPDGEPEPSWAPESLAGALSASRARDMAAGRTLVGPHRSDMTAVYRARGLPARQCSTGEQKALLLSVVLANARALARDFGAPPILLLDEVAAHLDKTRRAALFAEVVALGAQAWMTGTGPELFEALTTSALRLEVSERDGASLVAVA